MGLDDGLRALQNLVVINHRESDNERRDLLRELLLLRQRRRTDERMDDIDEMLATTSLAHGEDESD